MRPIYGQCCHVQSKAYFLTVPNVFLTMSVVGIEPPILSVGVLVSRGALGHLTNGASPIQQLLPFWGGQVIGKQLRVFQQDNALVHTTTKQWHG